MRKYLLIGIAVTMAIAMYAQKGRKDPFKAAEKQTEKMRTHLALSEAQYASVKKINLSYAEKIAALRKQSQENKENKDKSKGQRKDLEEQKQTEIYAVLTPEQQRKWTAFKNDKKQRKQDKGKHRGRHGRDRH